MTAFASSIRKVSGRKIFAGLLCSAVLAGALAPTEASAHSHHWGYGAAAGIGGGLLLGALIANSNAQPRYYYDRRCWTERRRVYDAYGYPVLRRVRVCG